MERLKMVMEAMPDDKLIKELEGEQKGRRDDYPVRAVWNSILAGIVYQHVSIESLRRELKRNGELRQACGFDPALGERAVPSKDAYSLMLKKLKKEQGIIDRMFEGLIEELKKHLTNFGRHLAIDSKKIESFACDKKDAKESSDAEADWGCKTYNREAGRRQYMGEDKLMVWVQAASVVDTTYELPVGYRVTKASRHDIEEMLPMAAARIKRQQMEDMRSLIKQAT